MFLMIDKVNMKCWCGRIPTNKLKTECKMLGPNSENSESAIKSENSEGRG